MIGNGINTYIKGQTTNGQSYYQWTPSDYYPPNTFSIPLLIRNDHAATGLSNSIPALTLYNGNGGLNTTVQLSFATPEEATSAGNSIPLAGLIAKKERAGTINNWTDGSLTFFTKNGSTRNDAIYIGYTGVVGINTTSVGSYQLQVNGTGYYSSILTLANGDNSTDNLRIFNTDGNYFRIRQTAASNSNNVWLDPVLGATMWLGWGNGASATTANTYTELRVGTGRENINEVVRMRRGDIEGWDSSGNVDFRIVSTGALGSHTYFNAGNVGIGTASPSTRLHLSAYDAANWISTFTNSGTSGHILYFGYNNGTGTTYGLYVTGGLGNVNQLDFAVENKFYVNGDGKVGIGTSTPAQLLDVIGTTRSTTFLSESATGSTGLLITSATANAGGAVLRINRVSTTTHQAYISLDSDQLYLGLPTNSTTTAKIGTKSGVSLGLQTGYTDRVIINDSGLVGINTSPSYRLDVNGNIKAGSGNATALLVSATGTATTSAAIAIQQLTTEGDTIIFADYEPYAEYGIIARNSLDSIDFTSGSASGLTTYSITNRSGNARTAAVQTRMSLNDGRLYVFNRIGIGTLSANKQLTFAQAADDAIQIRRLTTSQGNPAIGTGISWTWTSSTTDDETWAAIRVIMPGSGNSNMTFSTSSGGGTAGFAERMRISDAGNVGIGTNNPTSKLSITDTATMYAAVEGVFLDIKRNASNGAGNDTTARAGFRLANNSNGFQIYYGGSSDRLRFIDGGNLEVMSMANGGSITAARGFYPGWGINLNRVNGQRTGISHYNDTYYNWQEYMSPAGTTGCGPNGNLTAPSGLSSVTSWAWRYRMEGVSTYGFLWETGGSGGGEATASPIMELHATSGTLRVSGDMVAYASDGRLKTNIKVIENALKKVESIRGVEYDWIEGIEEDYGFHPTSKHEVGVIAQEIQQVLPEAVLTAPFNGAYKQKKGEDPNFLTVKYERVVPLLIEAIKELKAEVDSLRSQLDR